jgi:hypothetical protein
MCYVCYAILVTHLYLQTQLIRVPLNCTVLLNILCPGLHCYPSYVICFMGSFYQNLNCHPDSFISILYVIYVFPLRKYLTWGFVDHAFFLQLEFHWKIFCILEAQTLLLRFTEKNMLTLAFVELTSGENLLLTF